MSAISMTRAEREAFLADVHVGILAIANGERGPLAAPVWYGYEPGGELWFSTGRSSEKGRLLRDGMRASFVVQTESAPYQYVTIEGPIRLEECDYEKHVKPMAHRYLGREEGDRYLRRGGGASNVAQSVVVCIQPETWRTQDYSKLAR